MTDYTKLVEALRCCGNEGCHKCPYQKHIHEKFCWVIAMKDAAAAIEDLQKGLTTLQKCYEIADTTVDEVLKQLPKRGEWIIDGAYTYNLRELNGKAYEPVYRCSCCNRQTESYLRLDEPKMPEDADFPEYCPHCGAKMEVQE